MSHFLLIFLLPQKKVNTLTDMRFSLFTILLTIIFCGCSSDQDSNINIVDNQTNINIPDFVDFKEDSIVPFTLENISLISLETNESCLIKSVFTIRFSKDYIFIQNHLYNVLMFDRNGKFLRQIGARGRGPGEFRTVFSFNITNDEVLINDGWKINIYSFDGEFLRSIDTYGQTKIFADEFCYFDDNTYYLWVSDPLGKIPNLTSEISTKKHYHFYRIMGGNSTDRFVEVISSHRQTNRINKSKHSYTLSPNTYDTIIYRVDRNGIESKYSLGFKGNSLDLSKLKVGFSQEIMDFNDAYLKKSKCYYWRGFCETTRFAAFQYAQSGKIIHAIWDKNSSQTYSWKYESSMLLLENTYPMYISGSDAQTDRFYSIIDQNHFKNYIGNEHETESSLKQRLENNEYFNFIFSVHEMDNPILILYSIN